MSVYVSTCSDTAHRPFGHMGSIGARSTRVTDRQDEAVAELLAERARRDAEADYQRARRASHANCERRPLSMDKELT